MRALFSLTDLRQTLRRLGRERSFSATVLITLALCIGVNLTIFAVVDAILIRALPFPDPDRLVITVNSYPGAGVERAGTALPNYYDRREGMQAFESVSIINGGDVTIGEEGAPQRVPRSRVSPEFFDTLKVPLAMGRMWTDEEMIHEKSGVAVLTDSFWRSYFNGDPEVLGKQFRVDGFDLTVLGVLPADFRFLSRKSRFFTPASSSLDDRQPSQRHSNNYQMIARLKPGVSVAAAQAEMDAFNEQLAADDPYADLVRDAGFNTLVRPLHADHVRSVRPMLLMLQGGVLFLLLIGGVNLVNLLLVRASGRAKELAVRQALGASRRHVAREVLIETILLGLLGGLLGVGVGAAGIQMLAVLGTEQLPLGTTVAFDLRVAAVALGGSILSGVVLAIPVVWFNLHGRLAQVLHTESRSGTTTRAAQRIRHGFIIAQIALAFVLLSGAGLLGISLNRTLAADPGFVSDQVISAEIDLPWKNYQESEERYAFVLRLLDEVRNLPGVTRVGVSTSIPFGDNQTNNAFLVEGYEPAPGESIRAHYVMGTAGAYWQTLGIPLIEGRLLEDADNQGENRVCVVDQAVAQRYWPDRSALGNRICENAVWDEDDAMTVVGVVGSVKKNELSENVAQGSVYRPYRNRSNLSFNLMLKTAMVPQSLYRTLREIVLRLDPNLPIAEFRTMQSRIDDSLVTRRSPALLAGLFAAVALLLASVGTYGVLAYAVAQRRREIGVRMALGARPDQIRRQFLLLGVRLFACGVGLGLVGAWLAGRSMQSVLYGVTGFDPSTLGLTVLAMALIIVVACLLPSLRAARVSPVEALSDA